jgi:hypothetical protein
MDTTKADKCMEDAMSELKDKHPEMKHDQMVAIAMNKCGQGKALIEKANNPNDFAYVPDEKSPSTWKLDISDPEHIAGAITALQPGGFRGQKVEIPSGDKGKVISRIRAAINKQVSDKDKKQALLDRLDKVKSVESKAFMGLLDQAEVNYIPLSTVKGKACAACRWYMAQMDCCHLVEANDPEPILATGYCDRYEAPPPPPPAPDVAPIPVTIVEPMDDSMEMALPTNRKGFIELITDTVKSILNPAKSADEPVFSVFKANGKSYWIARHTGKFVDREDEIIANRAHDEYIERVQKGLVPLPTLCTWHKLASKHGQADMVWKSDGFTLAFGHFDDTPEAENAFRFYEKNAGKIKLSHMFNYPKRAKQGRVFYAYNTIEITTLPAGAEAFPYTSFEEIKPMALTKEQREFIKGVGGDDMLKRVEAADAKAADDTKALDALGIESKGLDNFEGATIPAAKSDVEALKTVQTDLETRLKAVEAMPDQLKALTNTIKALTEQVAASQVAESAALEKVNALEAKVLEYGALKPPASQSKDTLLAEREKSLLDTLMIQAKAENTPSLIEKLVGGQTTVAAGERI